MLTIGIDPGVTGAIAAIDHKALLRVIDMPVIINGSGGGKVKSQVNPAGLAALLREILVGHDKIAVLVLFEQVRAMPAQGVSSVFSLGHTAGAIEAVVATLGLPHRAIPPAKWKKHYKLTSDKEQARGLAQQLYPSASLARMKDHNRAEAILIARYGQEVFA